MSKKEINSQKVIPALKVKQWLNEWNDIKWNPKEYRAKPPQCFYQFSIPARTLKALSGIYPRTTQRNRSSDDLGIQRVHERDRSSEIQKFVKYGYPWSDMSEAKRTSGEYNDLQQPGWLPTALVVNILTEDTCRRGKKVATKDLIKVNDTGDGAATIVLPEDCTGTSWRYSLIPPIEVIDGQHRLWAFDGVDIDGDFDLPVVAFVGLDLSWQAYLFYTINIKPKKINASLAFDLYPLLRSEMWLNKFEGHIIYRETRAQELVDLLWSTKESPWFHRINMLGEKGVQGGSCVSQAAWVRSLLAAMVKSWESARSKIGGLFGAAVGNNHTVLPWNKFEQATFLIVTGICLRDAIENLSSPWTNALRSTNQPTLLKEPDSAFFGDYSLLNQDQGIRTVLHIVNDLCFVLANDLKLEDWRSNTPEEDSPSAIKAGISSLQTSCIGKFLKELAEVMANYDWRASSAPSLNTEERLRKSAFRGSGGYKALREDLLRHLAHHKGKIGDAAKETLTLLGY